MYNKILALVLLFFYLNVFSQKNTIDYRPYYQESHRILKIYENEEYEKAFHAYDSIFKIYEPIDLQCSSDYLKYIVSAELSNSCYERFNTLKKLVVVFGYNYNRTENDFTSKILKSAFEKCGIDKEINNLLLKKHKGRININLRNKIISIIELDQKYRRGKLDSTSKAKIKKIDSLNYYSIKKIFDKYGYPDRKLIGHYFSFEKPKHVMPQSVLAHFSAERKEEYLIPKLKEFVSEGTYPPSLFKLLVEGYFRYMKKPSPYYVNEEYGFTIDKVNQWRYDSGLELLEEK